MIQAEIDKAEKEAEIYRLRHVQLATKSKSWRKRFHK
jgi:hypothetical protein